MTTKFSPINLDNLDPPPAEFEGSLIFKSFGIENLDLPPDYAPAVLWPLDVEWGSPSLTGADTQGPVVEYLYPAVGTALQPLDPVIFNVADATSNLQRALVAARLASLGVEELAFDGQRFVGRYAIGSMRTAIADGWAFVLRRQDGWPSGTTVTVRVWATDTAGNVEDVPEEE